MKVEQEGVAGGAACRKMPAVASWPATCRVVEMLSGTPWWNDGGLLASPGRAHGFFHTYEAFGHVITPRCSTSTIARNGWESCIHHALARTIGAWNCLISSTVCGGSQRFTTRLGFHRNLAGQQERRGWLRGVICRRCHSLLAWAEEGVSWKRTCATSLFP